MPPQNIKTPKTQLAILIIGFLFFVVGGWSAVFLFPESTKGNMFIVPAIMLFTLGYIWIFIKYIRSPKKFIEQQRATEQVWSNDPLGKVLLVGLNSWNVDIQVFKIIFRRFSLFLPFIFSIIVILAVILTPLLTGFDGKILRFFYQNQVNPYVFLPIVFFAYSFICCSIYIFGYLTLGYVLRKKYLNINESHFVLVNRFFRLFGFVILLSFAWAIIVFFGSSKKKKSGVGSVVETAGHGLFDMFKFFVYMNIVRVALGDEKSGFRETYEFIKKDIYQMLRVWFGSGLLVGSALFLLLLGLFALTKYGIIPVTDASKGIIAPILLSAFAFVLIFKMFAIQIGTFGVYMKDRYNMDII